LNLAAILLFPAGLFVLTNGLIYEWIDRKMLARLQNRVGPRWFQPLADTIKLLVKEEIVPDRVNRTLFFLMPILALAGPLTATLYLPVGGVGPMAGFSGDLIVTLYLLSLLTLATGLAGANTQNRFSLIGATRTMTQLFSYEAPFLLAMLGPAIAAQSWQISEILAYTDTRWLLFTQPIGFAVAMIGLLGKLEMPPFDAPEAETEIVAGALTEYSGRGLALFRLGRSTELVLGLTLVASFYLGGISTPLAYFGKTILLLLGLAGFQALMTRLRIDQTVGLWWRYGSLLVIVQWLILVGVNLFMEGTLQ
jgi:NADH-quinone oxidoreductase subunit H